MYGIIGEDKSDVDTLKVLIRRLGEDEGIRIRPKGYEGCGEMLKKGCAQLAAFADLGCTRFVISFDSDGLDPRGRREAVLQQLVIPNSIEKKCCIVIPVQELEAWILADIVAVAQVFPSWLPKAIENPENIPSPKEHREKLSRGCKTQAQV